MSPRGRPRRRARARDRVPEHGPDSPAAPTADAGPTVPPDSGARQPPALLRHSPFTTGFFGALGAITAVFLAQQLQSISSLLVLIVVALFLAIGLNPAVTWCVRRGLRRSLAVLTVLLVVLSVFALFVVVVVPVISEQITRISDNAPQWLNQLQHNATVQQLEQKYDVIGKVRDYVTSGQFGQSIFGGVLGVGLAVLSALANTLIVLVLMIYFLVSLPTITGALYRIAPASRRPRVEHLGDRILRSIGGYVAGAFVVGVFAGVSTLIFTFIVGLGDYSFALAFIVGLLSLIPVAGSVVSALIITALGLTVSPTVALICFIYYMAYQQLEAYVIYPRIMTKSVDIPGSVTVIAALVGASLMGVIGALLAVPVAAALLLLHREVLLRRQDAR